jgi:hypothetical protein
MRIALITHNYGGGIEHHIKLQSKAHSQNEYFQIQPSNKGSKITTFDHVKGSFQFLREITDYVEFAKFLENFEQIEFHSILGWPEDMLWILVQQSRAKGIFTFHDYSLFAEGCHLLITKDGEYQPNPTRNLTDVENEIINQAVSLRAPSSDTASRIGAFLSKNVEVADFIELESLQFETSREIPTKLKKNVVDVAIPGHMAVQKGSWMLKRSIELVDKLRLPIKFTVLGKDLENSFSDMEINFIGGYSLESLPKIISSLQPSVIWWPTNGAETYSYTLSEMMKSGIPLCVPNRGSFPERTRLNSGVKLIQNPDAAGDHVFSILEILDTSSE